MTNQQDNYAEQLLMSLLETNENLPANKRLSLNVATRQWWRSKKAELRRQSQEEEEAKRKAQVRETTIERMRHMFTREQLELVGVKL